MHWRSACCFGICQPWRPFAGLSASRDLRSIRALDAAQGENTEVNVKRLPKKPTPPRFGRKLTAQQRERATHICLDCGYIPFVAKVGASPIVFKPRTLARTWGTPPDG